jgi:hypothetical protein
MTYGTVPPAPPAPPKKKTSPLIWILVGCLGLVLVVGIGFVAATWFVGKKVTEFAQSATDKPAETAAKIFAGVNPDIDFVSADEATGEVVLRDNKTGKELRVNYQDLKDGRLIFGTGEGKVVFDAKGEAGTGSISMQDASGKTVFQAGSGANVELPSWVMRYPGATMTGGSVATGAQGAGGMGTFETTDSVADVRAFYEREIKAAGLQLSTQQANYGDGEVVNLTGVGGNSRNLNATITTQNGKTQITLTYAGQ